MVRNLTQRLSAVAVKAKKAPGRYADGGGLYLFVQADGRRSWVFRYRDRITGKLRDKGLGPAWDVSLADARDAAKVCRDQLRAGVDPIDNQKQARQAAKTEHAKRKTFGECVDAHIAAHRASWRNAKHADQWRNTLDTYADKLLPLPVAEIDTGLVLSCLEPHWATKTETMTRVRQRIEAVLSWAAARGYRDGDNPARWRGHLDKLLPKPTKLKQVAHRAAVPYAEVGEFIAALRLRQGLAARALELQILTATRPNETASAQWKEFDLEAALWTIPAERMKAGREHRIPLSKPAVALLRALPRVTDFVFPGLRKGQPLSTAAMLKTLKELRPGMTVHGFRSTFRDWVADCTAYPADMAEFALAHALKDATVAAYLRADMLAKRARMMADWARFCATTANAGGDVTPIRASAKA